MTTLQLIIFDVVVVGIGLAILAIAVCLYLRQKRAAEIRRQWTEQPMLAIKNSFNRFNRTFLSPIRKEIARLAEAFQEGVRLRDLAEARAKRLNTNPGPLKRIILPILAALWLAVFVLQVILDIQILRGIYPDSPILAFVLGLTAALVISGIALYWSYLLGGHNNRFEAPEDRSVVRAEQPRPSWLKKLTIGVCGAVVLTIVVGFIVSIAPARSQTSNLGREVANAQKRYDNAVELQRVGGTDELAVANAQVDLDAAKVRLAAAENLDRTYAVIVPIAEIALSYPAVLACELFLFYLATLRVRRLDARLARHRQAATSAREMHDQARVTWHAEVTQQLLDLHLSDEYLVRFVNEDEEYRRYLHGIPATLAETLARRAGPVVEPVPTGLRELPTAAIVRPRPLSDPPPRPTPNPTPDPDPDPDGQTRYTASVSVDEIRPRGDRDDPDDPRWNEAL